MLIIMKKYIIPFAALAVLVACVQENEMEQPSRVFIKAEANETKTLLDGNAVVWESGDAVALRFTSTSKTYREFFSTQDSGNSATFSGTLANGVTVADGYDAKGYAVYPGTAMDASGNVSFSLPEEVTALESGSFASGTNLSSAEISLQDLNETGTTTAVFRNAFSIIRFTVPADVASVVVTADANLVGQASMTFGSDGRLGVGQWQNPGRVLTVKPEGTVFSSGKTYNVLVYPGTYRSLTVKLTDQDGCVYEKTVSGNFVFEPSSFNTFNFNTRYVKEYSFIATGRAFAQGDKVMTVFSSGAVLHEEELTAAAGARFTGNLPESVVHASSTVTGYAVYPSSAYSLASDKISYTLSGTGEPAELYSAKLPLGATSVAFNSVASALSKLSFTIPAGVHSVSVVSTKNFIGAAEMTVDANGKLVAGTPSSNEITLVTNGVAGTYTLNVYPVSGATLTFTLKDSAEASVVQTVNGVTVAAGATKNIVLDSNISYDKNGTFATEGYTDGGSHEF